MSYRRIAGDGQEFLVSPHRRQPRFHLISWNFRPDPIVIVNHFQRGPAIFAGSDWLNPISLPALSAFQKLQIAQISSKRRTVPEWLGVSRRFGEGKLKKPPRFSSGRLT